MSNFKADKIKLGYKCPCCKSVDMVHAGHGIGKHYKIKKRYQCKRCKSFTVNPIKI